ncbi:acyl-CoA dehydrogenase family protein [Novosphingobium sp. BL-8H]|uniref:acyl-CoA dehydrogenase family protein n=1 Tax=Novosphingobium sp. BL-8H TaxID=3127640 RepID=UPI0037583429
MDTNQLLEPFVRMLETICPPAAVRAVEQGEPIEAIWNEFNASGFLDALVDDDRGGAGLSFSDLEPLFEAMGANTVPLPVGETMIARALLAKAEIEFGQGPIALATSHFGPVPCWCVADQVLVDDGEHLVLVDTPMVAPCSNALPFTFELSNAALPKRVIPRPAGGLRVLAAVLRSAMIAGAAGRLLETTVAFANERAQFGKPIGRQQALQQNLAVMAQDIVAVRIAAQIGCACGLEPNPLAAAVAKVTASTAAGRIAATAHAIHGAIGISEEFDLQLLTRRLHDWRLADGAESYWSASLGQARLSSCARSVDWVRTAVSMS